MDINKLIQVKKNKSKDLTYKPLFFRLNNSEDKDKFHSLLKNNTNLTIYDEIEIQIKELIKCRNPEKYSSKDQNKKEREKKELDHKFKTFLKNNSIHEYGVWIYYPWSAKLIHLLDEKEFIEIRTNRNKYKITPTEQNDLSSKKIGIIGLSVGNSIALTLAIERAFKEIRLADFDIIELSNLNRIRNGLHNLGINKVLSTAREIAEIDPYLKVRCFFNGLDESSIDEFLLADGKIDLCIEECDDLSLKILIRNYAKKYAIPVIMETNDRGLIDIERFDLDQERPIFHGLIENIEQWDLNKIQTLSDEDKVPYIMKIVGENTLSNRFIASLMEISQTLRSWPQLSSAVTLGAGIASDVARRILLNDLTSSGRYYVDLNNIISNTSENTINDENNYSINNPFQIRNDLILTSKNKNDILNIPNIYYKDTQNIIAPEIIIKILNAAINAPSGRNGQSWNWKIHPYHIDLFCKEPDTLTDYNHIGAFVSFGAAAENFILAAHNYHLEIKLTPLPDRDKPLLAARFEFFNKSNNYTEPHNFDDLYNYIYERCTNRQLGNKAKIAPELLNKFKEIIESVPDASIQIHSSEQSLSELANIVGIGDRIRFLHRDFHEELINEIRWSPEEAEIKRDGIDIDTLELSPTDKVGLRLCRSWPAMKMLYRLKGGKAIDKLSKKAVNSASAMCLITMQNNTYTDYFNGGRAMQRVWLLATKLGLSFHPISTLPYFFARIIQGKGEKMNKDMITELSALRKNYLKYFKVHDNNAEILLFRLSYTDPPSKRSFRKSIDSLILN